jgi:tetratricopeptide (TPR) repeat protein
LVQVEKHAGRVRYRLLEPVRQYAHERLVASAELDAVRRQHTVFFLSFAERWETDANVGGPSRQAAHAALEQEQDNLRAALRWSLERGEAEMGLRLGRAHWNLWVVRGRFTEGRAWLSQLAALPQAAKAPALRAVALSITASLAWRQGGYADAQEIYQEALPLLRQANDPWLLHNAIADLGCIAFEQGKYQTAQDRFEEALAAARGAGHRVNEVIELNNLGWLACLQEDYPAARARLEESLALARTVGDIWVVSNILARLGWVFIRQGDVPASSQLLQESVVLHRQIGERFGWLTPLTRWEWGPPLKAGTWKLRWRSARACNSAGSWAIDSAWRNPSTALRR